MTGPESDSRPELQERPSGFLYGEGRKGVYAEWEMCEDEKIQRHHPFTKV